MFKGHSTTQTFIVSAICSSRNVGVTGLDSGIQGQLTTRVYILRESDLPTGVTVDSLTRNDRISDDGEFTVVNINKSPEFLIEITAEGTD